HVETAPTRELRRNRVPFYPAAVGVKIKVLRGFHRRVHVFQVERRRVLVRRRDRFVCCDRRLRNRRRRRVFGRLFRCRLFRRRSLGVEGERRRERDGNEEQAFHQIRSSLCCVTKYLPVHSRAEPSPNRREY